MILLHVTGNWARSLKGTILLQGFARSLYYVLNGAMECGLIGFLSDKVAAIAYILSVLPVFGFFNPAIAGTVTGGSAVVLMIFVICRLLRCPIKPEALTKMQRKSANSMGSRPSTEFEQRR